MRLLSILIIGLLFISFSYSTEWTDEEIESANTAKDANYLTFLEQDAILYINLARMYPKKYVKLELNRYKGAHGYVEVERNNKYRISLVRTMNRMKPVQALYPDSTLFITAKCLVKEQGPTRITGHRRAVCKKDYYAECISYGMNTGKDIAMQLLIDVGVKNLGHRKICFMPNLTVVGVNHGYHKGNKTMSVLDFK